MRNRMGKSGRASQWSRMLLSFAALSLGIAHGETCTTQSAMTSTERDSLVAAARGMAEKVLVNDAADLRAATIQEYAKDYTAIQNAVSSTSDKIKGSTLVVEQVYLLDATDLKRGADGAAAN